MIAAGFPNEVCPRVGVVAAAGPIARELARFSLEVWFSGDEFECHMGFADKREMNGDDSLSGCGPVPSPSTAPEGPEDVVDIFYCWYITYPGNPLADGAYRSSKYLTEELR